ncbi:hypothetical protein PBY51_021800 [Eleginops maclovinus]|uniref:Uncharacterized protein n=1 Tax=Eleginops maclovinus TaxID=56733 RepID=A0AAN7X9R4_ELEMC|nr:hypothetical protein PBY51_021800 [Eleginops maclovinus]
MWVSLQRIGGRPAQVDLLDSRGWGWMEFRSSPSAGRSVRRRLLVASQRQSADGEKKLSLRTFRTEDSDCLLQSDLCKLTADR